jgi:hypothetical protein
MRSLRLCSEIRVSVIQAMVVQKGCEHHQIPVQFQAPRPRQSQLHAQSQSPKKTY